MWGRERGSLSECKRKVSSEHPQITLSPASSDKQQERGEKKKREKESEGERELNRGANKGITSEEHQERKCEGAAEVINVVIPMDE